MDRKKWLKLPIFPEELIVESSRIILQSNREAVVEGCLGIVQYTEEFIQLQMKKMQVKFYGRNLSINCFNTENVLITGEFQRIEYLSA